VKKNDRLEFATELDMYPYTAEGLRASDRDSRTPVPNRYTHLTVHTSSLSCSLQYFTGLCAAYTQPAGLGRSQSPPAHHQLTISLTAATVLVLLLLSGTTAATTATSTLSAVPLPRTLPHCHFRKHGLCKACHYRVHTHTHLSALDPMPHASTFCHWRTATSACFRADYMYTLKGVVVHLGNAEMGHYYSFVQVCA
jgi:ubiquitin carboxyl-terminal hydrolase